MPPNKPGSGGTSAGNFSSGRQKPLGQLLKEMELVTEGHIQEALIVQRKKGGVIGEILVELGYVSKEEILLALAAQMGMEVVDLDEMTIEPAVIAKVPPPSALSSFRSAGSNSRAVVGMASRVRQAAIRPPVAGKNATDSSATTGVRGGSL